MIRGRERISIPCPRQDLFWHTHPGCGHRDCLRYCSNCGILLCIYWSGGPQFNWVPDTSIPCCYLCIHPQGQDWEKEWGNWSTGEEGEWTCSREADSTTTIFFPRHPHPHSTFWSDCLCLLLTPCSAADSALPVAGPVASTAFWRSIVDHSGCAAPGFHHWDH